MEIQINEDELKLLVNLRDHVKGFGEPYFVKPDRLEVGFDVEKIAKTSSYLQGWGFVLAKTATTRKGTEVTALHLLSAGEAYLREIDKRLQESNAMERGKRLGLATLNGIMDIGVKVAVTVLTEITKKHI